jgi:hypothetical protein
MQKKVRKPLTDARVHTAPKQGSRMCDELWVRPNSNFNHVRGDTDARNSASGRKLLELADVALGLKERNPAKKVAKALPPQAHHQHLQTKNKRALRPS